MSNRDDSSLASILMTSVPAGDSKDTSSEHHHETKTIGIAPMLDITNREFRQLIRILSKRVTLWTEMVVDDTILFCENKDHHLGFEDNSHPIVCQIGGNNPATISNVIPYIISYGYDEVNINMGCPSEKTADKKKFGAILMKQVQVAKDVVQAMQQSCNTRMKISAKCRVGVDDLDSLEYMVEFIQHLQPYCQIFYLHARKCILGGRLSTKQNRTVPPLNYPRVFELCRKFPDCIFYINGGIPDLVKAKELCFGTLEKEDNHQHHQVPCELCQYSNGSCVAPLHPMKVPPNLMGCLIGRAARDYPCLLWDIDRYFYGLPENPCTNRRQVIDQYLEYIEKMVPRRCCDFDSRQTRRIPCSLDNLVMDYDRCPHCVDFIGVAPSDLVIAPLDYAVDVKISSHVFSRALRPLIGIFHGIPRSKTFKRECDRLIQKESRLKNCGPAVLIKRALRIIDEEHLLKDFIKTEDSVSKMSSMK
jgi:tRNA-dihydrouridine synthase A